MTSGLTNDQIIEMAKQANKVHIEDEVFFEFCIAFARLIESRTREECAVIAEETHDECCVNVKYTDGYEISAAIRKGE